GEQQVLAGAEVVLDDAPRDAGPLGDPVRAGAVEAFLDDRVDCGRQHALAGRVVGAGGAQRDPSSARTSRRSTLPVGVIGSSPRGWPAASPVPSPPVPSQPSPSTPPSPPTYAPETCGPRMRMRPSSPGVTGMPSSSTTSTSMPGSGLPTDASRTRSPASAVRW